ncbi:MAG: sulfur carrier protein DsrE2 [Pseudomonadota bacterium]
MDTVASAFGHTPEALERLVISLVDARLDEALPAKLAQLEAERTPSMALISTKGTLDMAYPPFILASTASALGWDVSIFFTFYGLGLLKRDLNLEVSPLGNPAMPMKLPMGPGWLRRVQWKVPNVLQSTLPGYERFATSMTRRTLQNKGVASVAELREACIEGGVKLIACQMTVDLFGYEKGDFVDGIADWVGAASFLPVAQKADICLFI